MDNNYTSLPENGFITDIPGIQVGHAQDGDALTGCTVVLCGDGAVAGVDQRGGAPGTRETDLLRPMHIVQKVNAILLAGGPAFGLDAAGGVMRFLEEKNLGYKTIAGKIPIVPAAILYDLAIGNSSIRPNAEMGYQACLNANNGPTAQGNHGAGTGATVGKILGMRQATKSGIGSASIDIGQGVIIGAIIAVNAFGDVINPSDGQIIAGVRSLRNSLIRSTNHETFADTLKIMRTRIGKTILRFSNTQNTVIGIVATNARLNKTEANKVAQMAQNGLAVTIRPAHTMLDGDIIFTIATGYKRVDVNIVGAYAPIVVAKAIINAVTHAQSAGGLPSSTELISKE